MKGRLKSQDIALDTKSGNLALDHIPDHRRAAELLATVYVRNMDLNGGNLDGEQYIPQGNAGMGICSRIDNQGIYFPCCILNLIDQASL